MPPIEDCDLPPDPNHTVLRLRSVGSLSESVPDTFPSEAESLLKHLKLGAARPGSAPPPATAPAEPGPFPFIPGYEVEGELGHGGMGIVYKARHAALRHTVAIKMIQASAHADAGEVTRFVAEAEAVAQVKHPNVVQVFDLGVAPGPGPGAGRPYFIMEYIDGGNLAAHLKTVGGALAPDAAAELIETVARGVDAANAVGIVHRDLKPANILLAKDEGRRMKDEKKTDSSEGLDSSFVLHPSSFYPKVSDFGLAKRLSADLTRSQAVMGTPAYMAPEQAGGKAKFVGPQADVYALGVILYQCLTGAVPFDDPDAWALIRQVLEDAPPPVRAKAPHVSRDLELICLKCLEKEPHHRYPTAAALADDLRRFLNREAVSVRPIGPATRLVRWAKKRPAAAIVTAAGVLLGISIPAVAVGVKARFDRKDAVNAEHQKARVAAEQLAGARELFALQNKLRTRAAARRPGWTRPTLGELPRAVALAREPAVFEDLRSVAATALLADDLFPVEPVLKGTNAAAIATDPNTGLVAVGEHKDWLECKVFLIDPRTGATVRTLGYPPVSIKRGPFDVSQDGARVLTFSPDGARLFVGTRSGRLVRFDLGAKADTPARVWQVSDRSFGELVVSADGKTVYTVCRADEPVQVWAADTGVKQNPLELPAGGRVWSLAGVPGGGVIAGGYDKVYRWDADGRLVAPVTTTVAGCVAVGPESMLLVSSGGRLLACNRTDGLITSEFTDPALRRAAHGQSIRVIAPHPSRAFVATAAGDSERIVRVWEVASGRLVGAVAVSGTGPVRLAWSNDGEFLLATAHEQIARWRLATSAAQQFACGTALPTEAATFLPDGRVASLTELNGARELLVGRAGGPAAAFGVADPGGDGRAGLSADPNGQLAITVATKGLGLWTPGPPFPPLNFTKNPVRWARFGNDGRTLWAAFDAKEVRTLDPVKKSLLGSKWDNTVDDKFTGLGSVEALAAGRARAAVGTRDGSVYLLDAACNQVGSSRQAGDPVLAVAVAQDDSLVAAGTQNGNLRLIRGTDGTELPALPAHPTGVSAVAIGPGGTLLATGGRDATVRLWVRTGDGYEPLLTVSGLPDAVRDLQFHPTDGRLLVLLERQHAVRVWDIARLNALLAEHKLSW